MNEIDFTIFNDRFGLMVYPQHASLEELAATIAEVVKPLKEQLPLVKLGTFGTQASASGCLRHDENLLAITGVEADYDGGTLGFDDAVMIAEKAGLAALLYTSPSHSPTAPRWRVLCPASGPLAPGMRDRLMARLNGLYGGVFADESWALSQSYFFGRVNDAQPPQTAIVEGAPIDELDELDHIARGKPDTINPAGNGGNGAQRGPLDEQALLEAIIGGTDFHRACVRLLGRWAQRGMPMMEAQQRLVTAFECVMPPDRDQRWRTRFNDIPRCVLGIYDKEAGKQDNVVEFKISSTSTGANATPETDQQIPPQDAEAVDDADDIKLYDASDLSKEALPPREWLLGNVFCRQFLSSLLGSGGVGKTAIRILQALAVATGRNLTDEHVHQRCPVLFLSFEDGVLELKRRVRAAMLHHHISDDEVRGWFKYATITGHKLAETDRRQKIVPGDLPHWLRATIRKTGAGLVVFDPFIKTHGVSENDNSAMDQVCAMLADLAVELNFAADMPHHIRKGVAEPGDPDIGRGASATKDAGRLVYTATKMDEQTAELLGVAKDQRQNFVRTDSAKVNITPSLADAVWFELVDVAIGNATPQYPNGDHVQTVQPWIPSSFWARLKIDTLNQILDDIEAGPYPGGRYSPSPNAKERGAWPVILKFYPDLNEKQAKSMIATWIKNGVLVKRMHKNPRDRHAYPSLFVGKRPGDGLAF